MCFCWRVKQPATNGARSTAPAAADTYLRTIVPISGLYAGTLWLGNAAYIFLSVSFVQMLKLSWGARAMLFFCVAVFFCVWGCCGAASVPRPATHAPPPFALQASMPMAVFIVGCLFGTEHFTTGARSG